MSNKNYYVNNNGNRNHMYDADEKIEPEVEVNDSELEEEAINVEE